MDIENLIKESVVESVTKMLAGEKKDKTPKCPMVGRRCIVRTYSAGVHFGLVESVDETRVYLTDSCRLWSWKDGGLSLSAVNNDGMKGGRINKTGEIFLFEVIELIPTTPEFERSWPQFVE